MYTGTASDRTLRLFGVRHGETFKPFHSVTEELRRVTLRVMRFPELGEIEALTDPVNLMKGVLFVQV